jgi:HD-GYP domain-containing protein (c-di-GMP phosphodiesterase class II)
MRWLGSVAIGRLPDLRRLPRPGNVDRARLVSVERRLPLVELMASMSLATDLGTGQPMEHGLRTCVLADRAGEQLGLDAEARGCLRSTALLRFLGCTADASETAAVVGDEIGFNAAMAQVVMADNREALPRVLTRVGQGTPALRRVSRVAAVLSDPGGKARSLSAHCEVGARLGTRIGVPAEVVHSLRHAYERWDGKGLPTGLAGDDVPIAIRIAVVARDVDLFASAEGWDRTVVMLEHRSGRAYDPKVAAAFLSEGARWFGELASLDPWHEVTSADASDAVEVDAERLDQVLAAFADFADLKSPWFVGHSRAVAALAEAAAFASGLDRAQATQVRLTALVHDLGTVGISDAVWDRPGPLTVEGTERARLHPYLTERILGRCSALAPLACDAGAHHERLDGSGYYRATKEPSAAAQLVAAADMYIALLENRPHRPAETPGAAADALAAEADGGRLARVAVDAVLAATDNDAPTPNLRRPAELTEREVDVLRLIARGQTNKQTAAALGISAKTVGTHVEHIYAKAGVATRAGATLFAMENDLLRA